MLLRSLILLAPLWSYASAYNLETSKTFPIYLRDGGDTDSYTPSQVPAYAGFSFDATMKNNTPWIVVGQPRAGKAGETVSPGALYYCNITLKEIDKTNTTIIGGTTDGFVTTEANYAVTSGSGYLTITPEPLTKSVEEATSAYIRPTCNELTVFEPTNRQQRGVDHKTNADAFGLSVGKLGNNDEYAVCAPLRHRACPNKISYNPGACYFGNPSDTTWNFVNWNETVCFEDIVEIIFVVDGSQSIGLNNFKVVKQWLTNVTRKLIQTYGEAVRTEILQYANRDPSWKPIPIEDSKKFVIPYTLNDAYSIEQMEEKIRNMAYINGQTYTYYALQRAMSEFDKSDYKDNSDKIVVVLTDGEANDAIFLNTWYKENGKKVKSFAVGVGNTVKDKSLKNIANGNANYDRVFRVENFNGLQEIASNLTSEIASVASTEGSSNSSEGNPGRDVGSPRIGTSISYSKNGVVYLGGPGMYMSSGVVTQLNTSTGSLLDYPPFSEVEAALPNRTEDSYMGYSVVTGFFDGPESKEYVASGAPRYLLEGAVVVYDAIQGSSLFDNHVTIRAPSDGKQIASYYGGCLLSVDVSGDGKDDLLVAAPLFAADKYDEGRVFVYISQETTSPQAWRNSSFTPIQLSGDNLTGARFGTAMANAGDMNLDGYNDVIIGAPLVDNGLGAVYIYLGKNNGITEYPSQKIHASTLTGLTLQYFGQSLQGNIDVDDNQYPDTFVGAPKSDALVILKSRPVVKINATIYSTRLHVSDCIEKGYKNCSTLTVCFSANGTSVETMIGIRYTLNLDSNMKNSEKRVDFSTNSSTLIITSDIRTGRQYCATESLNMKKFIKDLTGVFATIDFNLSPAHLSVPFSSVQDPSIEKSKRTTIELMKSKPDLSVTGELVLPASSRNLPESFTQGERVLLVKSDSDKLTVRVNLTNKGEHSFQTKLKVTYPSDASLLPAYNINASVLPIKKCIEEEGEPESEGNYSVQWFHYKNDEMLMSPNSWCSFELDVLTDQLAKDASLDTITVSVTADTSSVLSPDIDTLNNKWLDSVKTRYQSDLKLRRGSSNTNFVLSNSIEKTIDCIEKIGRNTPSVDFQFRITSGYSKIPFIGMKFTWPLLRQDEFPLLYLYKLECYGSGKASCTCDNSKVNPYNLAISCENSTGEGKDLNPLLLNETLFEANCPNISGTSHTCESVTCNATDLHDADEVHFLASYRTWTSSIIFNPETTLRSRFEISTAKSTLVVDDKLEPIGKFEKVFTTARKQPEHDTTIIIIGAVSSTASILTHIILILKSFGVFRRKSHEELKQHAQDELDHGTDHDQEALYENTDQSANVFPNETFQDVELNNGDGEMNEYENDESHSMPLPPPLDG